MPDILTRVISGIGGDDAMLTGGPGLEAGLGPAATYTPHPPWLNAGHTPLLSPDTPLIPPVSTLDTQPCYHRTHPSSPCLDTGHTPPFSLDAILSTLNIPNLLNNQHWGPGHPLYITVDTPHSKQ